MVRNQIRASYVDWRIVSSQIVQKQNPKTRAYRSTKNIRHRKTLQIKSSHRRYTHLWNVCITTHKSLEDILDADRN